MGAGTVADSPARPLNGSSIAWVLDSALRFAVGTCVVALLLATTLSEQPAERFATVAYLSAIFAAFVLAVLRFVPALSPEDRNAVSRAAFPSFLKYSVGIAVLLTVFAALVAEPGAEVLALVACAALIVLSALVRSGKLVAFAAALHARFAREGNLVAAARYAVVAGVGALGLAALAPADASEIYVVAAYRLMVFATLFLAASLLATTSTGVWIQKILVRAAALLDKPLVFERAARYAAVAAVAAMISASVLPASFAEPFAIVAYLAAASAALALAMECRRLRA